MNMPCALSRLWEQCKIIVCWDGVRVGNYRTLKIDDFFNTPEALQEAMAQPGFALREFEKAVGGKLEPEFVHFIERARHLDCVVRYAYDHLYFKNTNDGSPVVNCRDDMAIPALYHALQVAYYKALYKLDQSDSDPNYLVSCGEIICAELYKDILHDVAEDTKHHNGTNHASNRATQEQIIKEVRGLFEDTPQLGDYVAYGVNHLTDPPGTSGAKKRQDKNQALEWLCHVAVGSRKRFSKDILPKHPVANTVLILETKFFDSCNNLQGRFDNYRQGFVGLKDLRKTLHKTRERQAIFRKHLGNLYDPRLARTLDHLIWKVTCVERIHHHWYGITRGYPAAQPG